MIKNDPAKYDPMDTAKQYPDFCRVTLRVANRLGKVDLQYTILSIIPESA